MKQKEISQERDSNIVLKKLYGIYEENINNEGLYDKLYWQLQRYKLYQLNKLKTELLAEEATKNTSTLVMSTSAMILSIMTIIFNACATTFSEEWLIIVPVIAAAFVLMWKFGNIFEDFIGKRKNVWKRNKYILCVIDDVLNER